MAYAGFWRRAVAYLVDNVILAVPLAFALSPILQSNHVGPNIRDIYAFSLGTTRQSIAFALLLHLADWLYSATLESSPWQATLGKRLIGLKVTDIAGRRLSFARASARHFGKYLSQAILLLGFAMAAFTEKKQALHDLLAGCLVVRNI